MGAAYLNNPARLLSIDSHMPNNKPDLTTHAPRSPRSRLGGYVILPRMLDKGRAELAGTNGEYHYNCPLDQRFLSFAGVDAEALKAQLATGKGDGEILKWITGNSAKKPNEIEIAAWSEFTERRVPSDVESRTHINTAQTSLGAAQREDIVTWFDLLDLDDYVSFGGIA